MGRGTQCFKHWLRDHCECTRRVCGCAACGQNHEFGTPCSWRVYMLLLLLLCDARNLFIVFFFLGFMWVCTISLSPACILRSAPRRVVVFSHSSFNCHTCICVCICVSYSDSSVISSLLLAVPLTLRLQAIRSRMLKFCLVVAGYVAMASLAYWV